MTTDDWNTEHHRTSLLIVAHPLFRQLVREVAVEQQPNHPRSAWLARNSMTYGMWMRRGMPSLRNGPLNRRARHFAKLIAAEADFWAGYGLPASEREGRVHAEAQNHVRNRSRGSFPVVWMPGVRVTEVLDPHEDPRATRMLLRNLEGREAWWLERIDSTEYQAALAYWRDVLTRTSA